MLKVLEALILLEQKKGFLLAKSDGKAVANLLGEEKELRDKLTVFISKYDHPEPMDIPELWGE